MNGECSVIRDLLPLYADDVCSSASRELIEKHLADCPECTEELEKIRSQEIETGLREEKERIIAYQAKRFKRRSTAVGAVIAGIFMIPILVCMIITMARGMDLGAFMIVIGGMAVAAALIIVPLTVPEDKLFWTFCAFCGSLVILLAIIAVSEGGDWFFTASSAALFGLGAVFLPFAVKARPVRNLLGDFSKPLAVGAADLILFAHMMNMISLRTKSAVLTILMILGCIAGIVLLVSAIQTKRGEDK